MAELAGVAAGVLLGLLVIWSPLIVLALLARAEACRG